MKRFVLFSILLLLFSCATTGGYQVVGDPNDPLYKLLDSAGLSAQARGEYYSLDFNLPDGRAQKVYCKTRPIEANTYNYYEFYTYSGVNPSDSVILDLLNENIDRNVSFWGLYPAPEGDRILVLTAAIPLDISGDAIYDLVWLLAIDGDTKEQALSTEDVF